LLRVDRATVRRWVAAGILPAYRLGRKLYIDRKDVHEFVAMSRTQTQRRQ
jgi:excisionase family DNA binding protein